MVLSVESTGTPDDGFAEDLLRSMRCGLMTVDARGLIRSINDQAREILELGAETGTGDLVRRALMAHPHLAKLLSDALNLSTLPDRAETEIRTKDNRGRTIGFTVSRVLSPAGVVEGAALFFKDLTTIERAQERQQLQERLAALGSMAASLAHEIRNPLAALELTTTLLLRNLEGAEPAAKLAQTIQEQVRRLCQTANSSLDYVRPLELTRTPVNLATLLDEVVKESTAETESSRVRVVRRFPDSCTVDGDSTRLRQALLNLVCNALEAMEGDGGVLTLVVEMPKSAKKETADMARVIVSDTGPGIPESIRHKIFNPFFSMKPRGSGLGLAWTRKVVDAHGGTLDVDSQAGQGTVFVICLPRKAAEHSGSPTPAE